jgi:hypothetical protein
LILASLPCALMMALLFFPKGLIAENRFRQTKITSPTSVETHPGDLLR